MAPLRLKIFLSSPGDVGPERAVALELLEELPYDPFVRGWLAVETVAWDKVAAGVPMRAHLTPQEAIDRSLPKPSECDIVLVVFWARMGTPLPESLKKPDGGRYFSGTEWEFEDAMRGYVENRRPQVLVYRRTGAPALQPDQSDYEERLEQWRRVERFFAATEADDGSLRAGWNGYATPDDFRKLLWRDLRVLVKECMDRSRGGDPATAETPLELWQGSPFPGLRAFKFDDWPIFFGRGRELDEMVGRLADPDTRFLAVVGASGSGKSSLVAAGLLPRLAKDAVEGSRDWRWLRCFPGELGSDPFLSLAAELDRLTEGPRRRPAELARELAAKPKAWAEHAETALGGRPAWARLVLFVDQFEELFTLTDEERLEPFAELLAAAARDPRTLPVVTVRADFYDRCLEQPELAELVRDATYSLAAPNPEALLDMIERPAHRAGLTFENGLAGRVVDDTGRGAGRLPLMAFALAELYGSRAEDGTLTHAAYEAFDGVGGAISVRAEKVFDQLGEEARQALPRVFRELVEVEEPPTVTRRRAEIEPLCADSRAAELMAKLIDARLLTSSEGPAGAMVEITHEALLERWPRLSGWIAERRDDLHLRRQLSAAADAWARSGERRSFRWSDERVVEVTRMLRRLEPRLSERERAFLGPVDPETMLELLRELDTPHELRATIGVRLALLGDPRQGVGVDGEGLPEIDWLEVAGGPWTARVLDDTAPFGCYHGDPPGAYSEALPPGHRYEDHDLEGGVRVRLDPFAIARYPITWRQFEAFGQAEDGYRDPRWWTSSDEVGTPPRRRMLSHDNDPVTSVTWFEARAFCRWLSERTGVDVRLPSIWQWELAATGGDPTRRFAWGESWDPRRANTIENGLGQATAVGMYPGGASPAGALDMCGNVWEWCSGSCETGLETEDPEVDRSLRGGSWNHIHENAQGVHHKNTDAPHLRYFDLGFRLLRR